MAGKKKLEISLSNGSLALEYNDSNHSSEPIQYYPVCSIKGIIATYQPGFGTRDAKNQRRNPYDFTDMLKVTIYLEGHAKDVSFDIQQVTNQAGWTANLAGLKQAISDIKDWAAECGCCAETAVLLGEVNANLISILNAIVASDQDIEVLLVRDTGAADVVVQQIIDYTTGTPVYSYKDVDGNAYVPVGPLVYLDPSAVLNLILTQITTLAGNTGEPVAITSMNIFDDDSATGFERRATYDPTTQTVTVTYHNPDGTSAAPLGPFVFDTDLLYAMQLLLSAINTNAGAANDAAPATDTDPSTLNGRLQRIAQNLSSLIALIPTSLGQKTMANSFAVTIASDQSSIPVSQSVAAAAAVTSVDDTASSTTLLASNAARRGAMFYNDSPSILYLKLGVTASTSSFTVKMMPEAYYELPQPIYTGVIDGIWSADASGAVRITELT